MRFKSHDELEAYLLANSGIVELELIDCLHLMCLPPLPGSLRRLVLSGCSNLVFVDLSAAQLTDLQIQNCAGLKTLNGLFDSALEELGIYNCPVLESLGSLSTRLTKLTIWGCWNLKQLPDLPMSLGILSISGMGPLCLPPLPKSVTALQLLNCYTVRALPVIENSQAHFLDGNWSLCSLDEVHQQPLIASDRCNFEPAQFVPNEIAALVDISQLRGVLSLRLAWKNAIAEAIVDRTGKANQDDALSEIVWLNSLLKLQEQPSVWRLAPAAIRDELARRFQKMFLVVQSLSRLELARELDSDQAVAVLHSGSLDNHDLLGLLSIGFSRHADRAWPETLATLASLKTSAFHDALAWLSKYGGADARANVQTAMRLVLTFGRSWSNWLSSRAKALQESQTDPTFIHDATFWLPFDPSHRLTGLSAWLILPQHRAKSPSLLGMVAGNWLSLTEQERAFSHSQLRIHFARRSYPDAKSIELATEAGLWGVLQSDYPVIEERFLASLVVASPFAGFSRWEANGLTARFLLRHDVRGLFLGQHTNCCQYAGGFGDTAAWYGQEQPNAGFFVIEDRRGHVVAQSLVWTTASNGKPDGKSNDKQGLVFDSAEAKGLGVRKDDVVAMYSMVGLDLRQHFSLVTLGIGTDKLGARSHWPEASNLALQLPRGHTPYTDSHSQVLLAVA